MNGTTTVSLVGVGGQGVLLGAAVLAETAAGAGLEVKASEVKGMAQRGGSVLSTVRFGDHVWSPVGPHADVVIATELLEGIRGLDLLGPEGRWSAPHTTRITPGQRAAARGGLPGRPRRRGGRARPPARHRRRRGRRAARRAPLRAVNVALLGAASTVLPFTAEQWRRGLEAAVPAKILEVNLRAFDLGRAAVASQEVES